MKLIHDDVKVEMPFLNAQKNVFFVLNFMFCLIKMLVFFVKNTEHTELQRLHPLVALFPQFKFIPMLELTKFSDCFS